MLKVLSGETDPDTPATMKDMTRLHSLPGARSLPVSEGTGGQVGRFLCEVGYKTCLATCQIFERFSYYLNLYYITGAV